MSEAHLDDFRAVLDDFAPAEVPLGEWRLLELFSCTIIDRFPGLFGFWFALCQPISRMCELR